MKTIVDFVREVSEKFGYYPFSLQFRLKLQYFSDKGNPMLHGDPNVYAKITDKVEEIVKSQIPPSIKVKINTKSVKQHSVKAKSDNIESIVYCCTAWQTSSAHLILGYDVNSRRTQLSLSKREMDCIKLLFQGKSSTETGKALFISKRTVEKHIENIKYKLQCNKKSELIVKLLESGFCLCGNHCDIFDNA